MPPLPMSAWISYAPRRVPGARGIFAVTNDTRTATGERREVDTGRSAHTSTAEARPGREVDVHSRSIRLAEQDARPALFLVSDRPRARAGQAGNSRGGWPHVLCAFRLLAAGSYSRSADIDLALWALVTTTVSGTRIGPPPSSVRGTGSFRLSRGSNPFRATVQSARIIASPLALVPGSRLGPYEIAAAIGAGGM